MSLLVAPILLVFVVALAVYLDARARDWRGSGYAHYSPLFWAVAVFLFVIVFVPGYLVARASSRPRWASDLRRA
jgi:p-aminobenzoyl-glutamate transporter AbgT